MLTSYIRCTSLIVRDFLTVIILAATTLDGSADECLIVVRYFSLKCAKCLVDD